MAVIENRFVCDLSKPVQAQALKGNVFSLDNLGSRLSVLIYDNGQPATISGSVTANCILPDGSTVNVNGGLTTENGGSKAYVDIPQSCLLIPGILKIAIKCTSSSVITTLAAIVANVYMTKTDNVITPSQQIITDWNAEISAAIANQDTKINNLQSALSVVFDVNTFYPAGTELINPANGLLYRLGKDHEIGTTWANTIKNIGSASKELERLTFRKSTTSEYLQDITTDVSFDACEWEKGAILGTGAENDVGTRIHTRQFIDVNDFALITVLSDTTGYVVVICNYDKDYSHISNESDIALSTTPVRLLKTDNVRYVRFTLKKSDSSAAITPSEGSHLIIRGYPSVSALSQAMSVKTDNAHNYKDGFFYTLDEITNAYRTAQGKWATDHFDTTSTYRHVALPDLDPESDRMVFAGVQDSNLGCGLIRMLSESSAETINLEYLILYNNPDFAIAPFIMKKSGSLMLQFRTQNMALGNNYFTVFPVTLVDYFMYHYKKTKKELIAEAYNYNANDAFPRDNRLWHRRYDGYSSGNLQSSVLGSTAAIQSAYIPYETITSLSIVNNEENVDLKIIGLDANKSAVCWTKGGVPGVFDKETQLTYATGKTMNDIKFISFIVFLQSGEEIDASVFDLANLDIHVYLTSVQPGTIEPKRIRLMEYNIGHYNYGGNTTGLVPETADIKIKAMKDFFGKYKPDILFMEEYQQQLIQGDTTSNANTTIFNPLFKYLTNTDGNWNTIRSIYPVSNIKSGYILPTDPYFNSKPYRYCEIDINGHKVGICCVHFLAVFPSSGSEFDNIVEARAYELEKALELFGEVSYGILAGDFNCSAEGEKESMNAIAEEAGWLPVNGGYFGWEKTWSYDNPRNYIDNFYIKGDIKVSSFSVLTSETDVLPSDHIPIISDIVVY